MTKFDLIVLGIDAAWTIAQPSGVALAGRSAAHWEVIAVAPSYLDFMAIAKGTGPVGGKPTGSAPKAAELLNASEQLAGATVNLVAIDMPLSRKQIVTRRSADNAVSRAYGGRKCGTHTPSITRPGKISDDLRAEFENAGYQLCTEQIASPGLIEVYPHPALVELTGAPERLPYKAGKVRAYWRDMTPPARRLKLFEQWQSIGEHLDAKLSGALAAIPSVGAHSSGADLKACEDIIDAIVCAWIAATALDGKATPFGDADSAIWIPQQELL
jgi:predicted RNase H-like nuclease